MTLIIMAKLEKHKRLSQAISVYVYTITSPRASMTGGTELLYVPTVSIFDDRIVSSPYHPNSHRCDLHRLCVWSEVC